MVNRCNKINYRGYIDDYDGIARGVFSNCEEFIKITVKINPETETVTSARYDTLSEGSVEFIGNRICEFAHGKTISELLSVSADDVFPAIIVSADAPLVEICLETLKESVSYFLYMQNAVANNRIEDIKEFRKKSALIDDIAEHINEEGSVHKKV